MVEAKTATSVSGDSKTKYIDPHEGIQRAIACFIPPKPPAIKKLMFGWKLWAV